MTRLLVIGLLLLVPLTVSAADDPKPPVGPAPTFVQAKAAEKGEKIQLFVTVTEITTQQRVVEVQVGNRVEKRTETVYVPVQKVVVYELDGKKTTLQRADGKAVDTKDIVKELGPGKMILLSNTGKVDPQYLKLFKDDTLILIYADK